MSIPPGAVQTETLPHSQKVLAESRVRIDTPNGSSYHVARSIADKKLAAGKIVFTSERSARENYGEYKIRGDRGEWIPTRSGRFGPLVLQLDPPLRQQYA
jgi:hypothetical protein